ncbi:MAG: endonuclease III [Candidatus Kapaibacterium sp.]
MSKILEILSGEYPDVTIQLNHNNAFELLIATILSAQCTDARVNEVTKKLFKKYNSPGDYVKAASEELEEDIYSTGFYKAKARNIKGACKMIINEFGGEVPGSMKDLLKLPGVGRKTANVLLGHMFDTPGIVVDTHVIKISTRLGFADTRNPEIIEKILENLIPVDKWVIFTHYFINHGRKVCRARKPDCGNCVINELCPSAFKI